ncbi:MAG: DUF4147 domain-containing protein [Trueperaceae bacterium]|nr:DUF4147 domain-containing protein [Trueperaceae bacterium]
MTSSTRSARAVLGAAFDAAVRAADPARVLVDAWPDPPRGQVLVLGMGKAAVKMAAAAEAHYRAVGVRVRGAVSAPHGSVERSDTAPTTIEVLAAGHPVPDAGSEVAGRRLLQLAAHAVADDLVLVLVSGGGSALATVPDGVTREQLAGLSRELLASGADIREMNVVRRRLDAIKGGRLAAAAHPAQVAALIVSDVVGDDPLDIASGPTVGDPGEARAALDVLDRYGVAAPAARDALRAEAEGRRDGPPRPDDPRLARCRTTIVASGSTGLAAAREVFEAAGVPTRLLSAEVVGDAREAGRRHAREAASVLEHGRLLDGSSCRPPVVLLSGGETTVHVRGEGRGGRNSTFALALALALPSGAPVHALAADSDGIDGVGGHAGAFVDPGLFERIPREEARALDASDDSYAAFERAGGLFTTGPTGTNVNDLRFVWVHAWNETR